jgi:hypothetical protein
MENMLARFEILMALTVNITSLSHVMPYSLVKNTDFYGNSYLQLQVRRIWMLERSLLPQSTGNFVSLMFHFPIDTNPLYKTEIRMEPSLVHAEL